MIATRKTKGATMANDKQGKLPDTIEELVQMAVDDKETGNALRDQAMAIRDQIDMLETEYKELEQKYKERGNTTSKAHRLLDQEIARRIIQGGIDG